MAYSEAGHFQERTGLAASRAQNNLVCMYRSHRGCTSHSRELQSTSGRQTGWLRKQDCQRIAVALGSGLHIGERPASSFCKSCSSLRGVQVEIFRGVASAVVWTVGTYM